MRMQIVLTLREVLNVSVSQVTLEMEKIVKVWTGISSSVSMVIAIDNVRQSLRRESKD